MIAQLFVTDGCKGGASICASLLKLLFFDRTPACFCHRTDRISLNIKGDDFLSLPLLGEVFVIEQKHWIVAVKKMGLLQNSIM